MSYWDIAKKEVGEAPGALWGKTLRTLGKVENCLSDAWDFTKDKAGKAWDFTTDKAGNAWDWTKDYGLEGAQRIVLSGQDGYYFAEYVDEASRLDSASFGRLSCSK